MFPEAASSGAASAPGWSLRLRDPAAALRKLDAYEGAEYRRTRVICANGGLCWTYVWSASTAAFATIPAWPPHLGA